MKSNIFGDFGCSSLCDALTENLRINHLDISDNNFESKGGMAVAKMLQMNSSLTNLFISGCKLTATSLIAIFTVLGENRSIQQLDISNNVIPSARLSNSLLNDVMTHLSIMIRDNITIKILDISKMCINDDAVANLIAPAIGSNSVIEFLNLSR